MAKGGEMLATIGPWTYIAGLVIAVIAGFTSPGNATVLLGVGALGLIVGLLNVSDREVKLFLVAAIAFLLSATSLGDLFKTLPYLGGGIESVFQYLVAFTAPAAAIVALKALYDISKSR